MAHRLKLKPVAEGGCRRYHNARIGIGASQTNPFVTVSDESDADYLVATGTFKAVSESGSDSTTETDDAADSDAGDDGDETSATAICGAEMVDGSVCERLAGECPYHGG